MSPELRKRCPDSSSGEVWPSPGELDRPMPAITSGVGSRPSVTQIEVLWPEFAELLPDAVYVFLNADARIVTVNSACVRQFGAAHPDEIIGRSNFEFVGEEHHEDSRTHMRYATEGREPARYLKRRRLRLDGTAYPAEVSASPTRWNGLPAMLVVVRDLSEVARTEQTLRSARDQLAEAIQNVSDGLALFDADERFVFANSHYLANDPARDEWLKPGTRFEDFTRQALLHNRKLPKGYDIDAEVSKRLAWFRSEGASNEFQDGLGRWSLVTHRRAPSGGIVIMSTDITGRKKIEQEVHERAEQLRLILFYAPFGIYVRKGRRIILANRALIRMLGATSDEELIGRDIVEMIHPNDRATVIKRMEEGATVSATQEPFEQRYLRVDGGSVWTEATPTPIDWEGERGALVFLRDATQRREMRRAYEAQQTVLREALESIREGIWIYDADQRLVIANAHVAEMLQLPPEYLKPGTLFQDVMRFCVERGDDGDGDVVAQFHARMKVSETREPCTFELKGPNGRIFEVRYAPMPGGGLVATRNDITERRELERSRENMTKQLLAQATELRRSNEELEQFAYVASHDLQEPLRSISGYCQLLQRRYKGKLDASADEFIQFAVEGAQRMQVLINDLLHYSRVGTRGKQFEPTDCTKVATDAIANLRQAIAEAHAEVICRELPSVEGDPVQLGQLFQNLIGNAIKFRAEAAPVVRIEAENVEGETVFTVADNGIGIEPRHQERIFQIFQRLHERGRYPGTGIGLAVCKKIVTRHGGRIWVESAPGEGARFRFTLAREHLMPTEEIVI